MKIEEVKEALKGCIVNNLGVDPNELEYDTPLFEEGIGLDSIDSIELVSFIDEEYGVSTSGIDRSHFRTINSLAEYIVNNK